MSETQQNWHCYKCKAVMFVSWPTFVSHMESHRNVSPASNPRPQRPLPVPSLEQQNLHQQSQNYVPILKRKYLSGSGATQRSMAPRKQSNNKKSITPATYEFCSLEALQEHQSLTNITANTTVISKSAKKTMVKVQVLRPTRLTKDISIHELGPSQAPILRELLGSSTSSDAQSAHASISTMPLATPRGVLQLCPEPTSGEYGITDTAISPPLHNALVEAIPQLPDKTLTALQSDECNLCDDNAEVSDESDAEINALD